MPQKYFKIDTVTEPYRKRITINSKFGKDTIELDKDSGEYKYSLEHIYALFKDEKEEESIVTDEEMKAIVKAKLRETLEALVAANKLHDKNHPEERKNHKATINFTLIAVISPSFVSLEVPLDLDTSFKDSSVAVAVRTRIPTAKYMVYPKNKAYAAYTDFEFKGWWTQPLKAKKRHH